MNQQWEYKALERNVEIGPDSLYLLGRELNAMGKKGWELVATAPSIGKYSVFIFKRLRTARKQSFHGGVSGQATREGCADSSQLVPEHGQEGDRHTEEGRG